MSGNLLKPGAAVLAVLLASAMPLLAQAVQSASEPWIVAPGESPRSLAQLLFPAQPGVQRRFIAALAAANPDAGIDASGTQPLTVGMPLQMPDWRTLGGGTASPARSLEKLPGTRPEKIDRAPAREMIEPVSGLRLATSLPARVDAGDQMRDILRQEYRLLSTLNEALLVLTATPLAPATTHAPLPTASTTSSRMSAPPSPVTTPPNEVPPPVSIRKAAPVTEPARNDSAWMYYAGLGAAGALLSGLLLRRRRMASVPVPFEMAQTILLDLPLPGPPLAAGSAALPVDKAAGQPAPAPAKAPKVVAPPPEFVNTDANPVMELAEIMLSFGRLEGAAQTLQEYIEANPKETLLPWVKLLEIYRTGGMHAEFDELAQKLNKNFNVEVQHWAATEHQAAPTVAADESLPKALTLEALPHICPQIIAQWGQPACLDYLHQLLRNNRGGQRSGFTLPVVQEILLLIDILVAREAT